jgi:NAD-dependent dihydropyrimidine dehydrogenase PreA subunit
MTYVIAEPCVDVLDRACVEECPVDCIYEGERALYISPDECVDCGACEPVCPVEAIFFEEDVPTAWAAFTEDNARFFSEVLPGRDAPLAAPGGASRVGPLGVDTPLVAGLPLRSDA